MARLCLLLTATLLAAAPAPAFAQVLGGRGQAQRIPQSSGPPPNSPTSRGSEAWPRLDPGALFCRSLEDLNRHHAAVEAQNAGTADAPALSRNCRLVSSKTPVEVVARRGLGRTQVKLSVAGPVGAAGDTGWTDAWLPERNPGAR